MTFLLVAWCYAGLCALSLAMRRHHRQCWGRDPSPARVRLLRAAGVLMLLVVPALAARHWGSGEGIVVAVIAAGIGGAVLVPIMAYRPRGAAGLALTLPPLALVLLAVRQSLP